MCLKEEELANHLIVHYARVSLFWHLPFCLIALVECNNLTLKMCLWL